MTKILDMVPDFVNKFTAGKNSKEDLNFEDIVVDEQESDSKEDAE